MAKKKIIVNSVKASLHKTDQDTNFKDYKIKDMVEEKIALFMKEFKTTYGDMTRQYKSMINVWYMLYRCIPLKKRKGMANTSSPEVFTGIESLINNVFAFLFPEDEFFTCDPVPPETEENAELNVRLILQELKLIGFKSKIIPLLRKCAIEGVVPCYVFFHTIIKKIKKPIAETKIEILGMDAVGKPITKETKTVSVKEVEEVEKRTPDFEIIPIEDVFCNPFTRINEMSGFMYQKDLRWNDLVEMEKDNQVVDIKRLKEAGKNKKSQTEEDRLKEEKWRNLGFNVNSGQDFGNDYKLQIYFGKIPKWWLEAWNKENVDEELLKELMESEEEIDGKVISSNGIILNIEETPFWHKEIPVLSAHWIDLDGEFYTPSSVTFSERIKKELDTTGDQLLDHKTFALYNMWAKDRNANIKNSQLKIKKEHIIECTGNPYTSLMPIRPDPAAFNEGERSKFNLKDDIQRAIGATATMQGIKFPPTARQTKGEVDTLASFGSGRAWMNAVTFSETFLKPLLTMFYKLNRQFIKDPVYLIGSKGLKISQENMTGDFLFIPKVMTDAVNRSSMKASLMSTLDLASRMPPDSGIPILHLFKKIYELQGFRDADVIFPPTPAERNGLGLIPEDEHKVIEMGQDVFTYNWYDHLKHLEKHVPYRKELMDAGHRDHEIAILDKDILGHFNFISGMQNTGVPGQGMPPQGGMPPTTGTVPGGGMVLPQ